MRPTLRGSEVFLKEDVRSVLQAILVTNESATRQVLSSDVQGYRYGFAAALAAVATAFDIYLELPPHDRSWFTGY